MTRSWATLLLVLAGLASCKAEAQRIPRPATPSPTESADLPVVRIEAKDPIVSDRRVACSVRIGPRGTTGPEDPVQGLIRIHGGVSRGHPKKSYGLTLETPVPWLGLPASRHWVLIAAFIDRSLMRHKLSYDLFRSLGAAGAKRYAAESRFVEVHCSGRYDGVYLLMQRVDRALLELRPYDGGAPSHACLYKAVNHAADFSRPNHQGYELREPDAASEPYWGPLDEFNRFVSRSTDAAFRDPQSGIAARLDIDNAIDFHLLVLLTSNLDGITKNFILARDAVIPGAPAPRFFFVPWDYDATFGRNWNATPVAPTAWLSNHLFNRLHGDAGFRRKWAARWRRLRERELSVATVHRLIDDNARTLGAAAERNAVRWRADDGFYPDRLTFTEDVAQMKQWIVARTTWLDAEIRRRGGPP